MADAVNLIMERMIPELEALEKQGVFTREELREVVRRRTAFEYKLRRSAKQLDDYFRYIDYELQLEALRQLRLADGRGSVYTAPKRKPRGAKARGLQLKAKEDAIKQADSLVVKRVLLLFSRAAKKFKGELPLWHRYLAFCHVAGSRTHLQKVIAQALRLHPLEPSLWLFAARFEFEERSNTDAARALLQRALRVCPNSTQLWVEYLRMELTYLRKVKARQLLLGAREGGEDEVGKGKSVREDGDGERAQGLREEGGEGDGRIEKVQGEQGEGESGSQKGEVEGKEDRAAAVVARSVCRSAVRDLPRSFELRLRLLDALAEASGGQESSSPENEAARSKDGGAVVTSGNMELRGDQTRQKEDNSEEHQQKLSDSKTVDKTAAIWLTSLGDVAEEMEADMLRDFAGQPEAVEWMAERRRRGRERGEGKGEGGVRKKEALISSLELWRQQLLERPSLQLHLSHVDYLRRVAEEEGEEEEEKEEEEEEEEEGEGEGEEEEEEEEVEEEDEEEEEEEAEDDREDKEQKEEEEEQSILHLQALNATAAKSVRRLILTAAKRAINLALKQGLLEEALVERHVALLLQLGATSAASAAALEYVEAHPNVVTPGLSLFLMRLKEEEEEQKRGGGEMMGKDILRDLGTGILSMKSKAVTITNWEHPLLVPFFIKLFQAAPTPALISSALETVILAATSTPASLSSSGRTGKNKAGPHGAGYQSSGAAAVSACSIESRRAAVAAIQCAAIDICLQRFGLPHARQLVDRALSLPLTSPRLLLHAITMELQVPGSHQEGPSGGFGAADATGCGAAAPSGRIPLLPPAASSSPSSRERVRLLFETAVAAFGASDCALWLAYSRFALQEGDTALLARIHDRARKTLKEPLTFVAQYQLMLRAGSADTMATS